VNTPDLPKITRRRKALAGLALGFLAATGVWLLTRPRGPGLDPDAASYLGAAEAVAHGIGYRVPIAPWMSADSTSPLVHFPPGYPTAIALPMIFGVTPLNAARLVNAAAAFVEIAVAVRLVAGIVGILAGLSLGVALLVMHALVMAHLAVLSEPLFLACMVCTLAAMHGVASARDERSRVSILFLGGLAAAGAMLVRYAGISVLGAIVLWPWLQPARLPIRARRAIVTALPSAFLFGAWVARAYLTSGPRSIRTLGAYGGMGETMQVGLSTVVAWLVPLTSDDNLPGRSWLALVVLFVASTVAGRGARLSRRSPAGQAILAAAMLAICYLLVLVLSRLLADPGIPFDERLLLPAFLPVAILAAIATPAWWRTARRPARLLVAILFVAWIAASIRSSEDDVAWELENGHDFTQPQWTASPLLAWARTNATRRTVYTNWPAAVVFNLRRAAHETPNDSSDTVLAAFADTVKARQGVVLAFDQPSPDQIGPEALARAAGLRQIVRFDDGSIFVAAP
jgi:hypothetical protein